MDGNGRWAEKQGKLRTFGHKAGVEAVRASVRYSRRHGIESLTLFAFSSENWHRPQQEVSMLMDLFSFVLKEEVKKLNKNDVRLRVVGDIARFDSKLVNLIHKAEQLTQHNRSLNLNVAVNYGGRWDIVQAAQKLAQLVKTGDIALAQIDENLFSQQCCLAAQPELDLLIRTGGEMRISNFLLWQAAYAELYFTPTLWPDFNEETFAQAVAIFAQRERRFGGLMEQDASQ
jgi:undecaprenyl diphosphate synthase